MKQADTTFSRWLLGAGAFLWLSGVAIAADPSGPAAVTGKLAMQRPNERVPTTTEVEVGKADGSGYCAAIRAEASNGEIERQKKDLEAIAQGVDKRLAELRTQIDALRGWMQKRDAFVAQARGAVVQIYAKMEAQAAATQLAAMAELTASAIILQLNPKQASSILAQMEATKAARISAIVASSAELGEDGANGAGNSQKTGDSP